MLRDLFRNRLFIGALAFFVLIVVSGTLYLRHIERQGQIALERTQERLKQREARQKQTPKAPIAPSEKVPEGETPKGGHFHADGTVRAEPHVISPLAVPPSSAEQTPLNAIDMSKLSSEEYEQVMIQFYQQAGVAPTPEDYEYLWEAPWVVKRGVSGEPVLHKIGDPIINIFYIKGFAPTPEQHARYQDLVRVHNDAVSDGDTIAVEQALQKMSNLQDEAQGDLPVVDSTLKVPDSMNLAAAKENERQKVKEALDAAYAELGLSHLREN